MSAMDVHAGNALLIDDEPVDRAKFNRAALDPSHSVVIEAAAGSGKTWLLVARMVRALLAGAAPSAVLAITFTRKAAAEMRERLVRALEELAACAETRAVALLTEHGLAEREALELLPRARDLLEAHLTVSPSMTIDTFHGWFARIARSAPLAAGIPAGFEIAEKTGALRRDAWRRFLNDVSSNEALRTHYLELLKRAESASTAKRLLDAMLKRRNEWKRFLARHQAQDDIGIAVSALARELGVDEGDGVDPRAAIYHDSAFVARHEAVLELYECGTRSDREHVAKAHAAAENIRLEFTAAQFELAFAPFAVQRLKKPRDQRNGVKAAAIARYGSNGEARLAAEARSLIDLLKAASMEQTERDVLAINRAAFHCGAAYIAAYEAIKREQSLLDFDDLEWHAAALMSDDASAAYVQRRLDARYQHILVDEFQDTNPLQWMVLKRWLLIYTEDADLAAARPSVFIVGDPKQSIYRFRRAEPRLFNAARAFLKNDYGAMVLRTDETRRVAPALMDELNTAFVRGTFSLFHPHRSDSHAEGEAWRLPLISRAVEAQSTDEAEANAPLVLRDVLTTPRAEKPEDLHDVEARAIVDALRAIVGRRMIDDTHGGRRLARWGDVMILARKRSRIAPIENALRASGIAYASARRGGLLETLEASDLCALLQVLVAPFSDLALAQTLRSPLFGCSDDDLIRLASLARELPDDPHPHWWSRLETLAAHDDPSADTSTLARAHRLLSSWRVAAATLPAHDLLDRIVHEGEWNPRNVAATVPEMRDQVRANLSAYLELALAQDSGRFPSLPRFIDELTALARIADDAPDEGAADHESDMDAGEVESEEESAASRAHGNANAVRILTVHGAKGLEAPIVVIADAHPKRSSKKSNDVLIAWPPDSDAPLHLSVFGKVEQRGAKRDMHFEREAEFSEAEDWNVLYVAATRAREVLLIAGCVPGKADDHDSWYRRLESLSEWSSPLDGAAGDVGHSLDDASTPETSIRVAVFSPPLLSIGKRRIDDDARAIDVAGDDAAHDARDDAADNERARRIGIALHRVLERQGRFASSQGFDRAQSVTIAMHCGLSASAAAMVADRAARMWSAPELRRFFAPAQYAAASNEFELLTSDGQLMRIDRLVEFAAHASNPSGRREVWVLDYKSQHRSAHGDVAPAYVEQLARYRREVASLYPHHVVRSALIFGDGSSIELRDPD